MDGAGLEMRGDKNKLRGETYTGKMSMPDLFHVSQF